jgi:transposase-like protein
MTAKRPLDPEAFNRDAVRRVTEQGSGVAAAARPLGRKARRLGRGKRTVEQPMHGAVPGQGWGSLAPEAGSR